MMYDQKMLLDVEQPNSVPESGDGSETEILDASTKTDLGNLALQVDIMNDDKEAQFNNIDALFGSDGKINQLDENKKNEALKFALKDSKIKMGSGDNSIEVSVIEIAQLFGKYVNQDGDSWKLNVESITDENDKKFEGALRELVSSPKQSPLAYLIQKASNFAKIQAENGYGEETEANRLREIKEDKILGNQTRRALAGLKSWVEGGKIDENNIPNMTVDQVLEMKYISADLKDKLIANGGEEVKQLWEQTKGDNPKYEYRVPFTNNYALKEKGKEDDVPLQEQNHSQDRLNTPDYNGKIDSSLKNSILEAVKQNAAELIGSDYILNIEGEDIRLHKKGKNSVSDLVNFIFGESIPIKKCLNQHGDLNLDYIKSAVSNAIDNIKMQERAQKGVELIKAKRYYLTDVFPNSLTTYGLSFAEQSQVQSFFFEEGKKIFGGIGFSKTELSGQDIGVVLASVKTLSNPLNLSYSNYPALKIKAKDVVKEDNTLDEDAFKEKLRTAIIEIIRDPAYINSLT